MRRRKGLALGLADKLTDSRKRCDELEQQLADALLENDRLERELGEARREIVELRRVPHVSSTTWSREVDHSEEA